MSAGDVRTYNGHISRLAATQQEHSRRLDKIEECMQEDHDKLTVLEERIKMIEAGLEKHLKWHEDMENKLDNLKYGIIILMIQFLVNWLALYYMNLQ